LREDGLNTVEGLVFNGGSKLRDSEAFVNSIGAVYFTILDKMAGVSSKSMNLLA
jgi:hypothetical protein